MVNAAVLEGGDTQDGRVINEVQPSSAETITLPSIPGIPPRALAGGAGHLYTALWTILIMATLGYSIAQWTLTSVSYTHLTLPTKRIV